MADTKLTDASVPSLTAPATNDLLYIIDISDTTDDPAGTSKKITREDFLKVGELLQAYDAGLTSIAGLTTAANKMLYTTAEDVYAATDLTSFGRSLLDDADATEARATLGAAATSHTHTAAQVTDFNGAADARITAQKAQANGLATLGADSKIPTAQLPSLAISEFLGNFSDTTAALADAGVQASQKGDWFTVDDNGSGYAATFIITTNSPTTTSHITEIITPDSSVQSVNGQIGTIVLTTTEISEGSNLYYTQVRFDSAFGAKTTADLTEDTNLYFTNARAISALTGANISIFTNNAGYLTSYTETDPVFSASAAAVITNSNITNWNAAFGWGDHSVQGYLTSITSQALENLSNVTVTDNSSGEILRWTGTAWINNTLAEAGIAAASHTHTLSNITDAGSLAGLNDLSSFDTDDISEGAANLYYTEVRVSANADVAANTAARHTQNTDTGTTSSTFDLESGGTGVRLKNSSGELQIRNLGDSAYADVRVRNLIVEGTTTTIQSETVTVADNIMLLNSDVTGTPTEDAGIHIERGTQTNASLIWSESNDYWMAGLEGSEARIILSGNNVSLLNNDAGYLTSIPDSYLRNDGDVGTGTYDFGGATSFEIPNSAEPTINTDGQIAIDTSITDLSHGLLKYYSGESMGVVAMPIAEFSSFTDGHVVAYNATNNEFELVAQSGGGGASSPLTLTASSSSEIPLTLQGAVSQTADLLVAKDSSSTNLLRILSSGKLLLLNSGASQSFNQIAGSDDDMGFRIGSGQTGICAGIWRGATGYLTADANSNAITIKANAVLGWGNASTASPTQMKLTSPATDTLSLGQDNTVSGDQTFRVAKRSGTNTVGYDLIIAAGAGNGTGNGGAIKFQTAPPGASGSTSNTLEDAGEFDDNETAGETRFRIYDITAGILQRVSIGATDSGGSGYRLLRIPN